MRTPGRREEGTGKRSSVNRWYRALGSGVVLFRSLLDPNHRDPIGQGRRLLVLLVMTCSRVTASLMMSRGYPRYGRIGGSYKVPP